MTEADLRKLHERVLTHIELAALRTRDQYRRSNSEHFAFDFFAEQIHSFIKELHEVEAASLAAGKCGGNE